MKEEGAGGVNGGEAGGGGAGGVVWAGRGGGDEGVGSHTTYIAEINKEKHTYQKAADLRHLF